MTTAKGGSLREGNGRTARTGTHDPAEELQRPARYVYYCEVIEPAASHTQSLWACPVADQSVLYLCLCLSRSQPWSTVSTSFGVSKAASLCLDFSLGCSWRSTV